MQWLVTVKQHIAWIARDETHFVFPKAAARATESLFYKCNAAEDACVLNAAGHQPRGWRS
jgi:hypothetical protein